MKKIYSLLAAVLAFTAVWASLTSGDDAKVWNFSDWEKAKYESTVTIDGLTVYAESGKAVEIDKGSKTINGVSYTQRLKFGGTGAWSDGLPKNRVLGFDVDGACTVEVAMTSSSDSGTGRMLQLFAGSKENMVGEFEAPAGSVDVVTYEYTGGATTLYMASSSSGINLYFIKVTPAAPAVEPIYPAENNATTLTWMAAEQGYENAKEVASVAIGDDITVSFAKGSNNNATKYYDSGSALRVYGGNTVTFECTLPGATIRQIVIVTDKSNALKPVQAEGEKVGEFTSTESVVTWTGSAATLTFSQEGTKGNGRIISIEITYGIGENEVEAPAFSLPATAPVRPGTEVEITCATEGAVIYYTTDEAETLSNLCQVYSEPIVIGEEGCYLRAFAVLGDKASAATEAWYQAIPTVDTINNIEYEDGLPFIYNGKLTVVYVNGKYNYVYDGQGYGLIFAEDLGLAAGDVIAAGWEGNVKIYNGLFELVPSTALTVTGEEGEIPAPLAVGAEDASMFLAPYNANLCLTLEGVTFAEETPETGNFTGTMGEGEDAVEVTFRNNFGVASVAPGTYNVTGFVGVYNGAVQFYPTEIALEKVYDFNALSDFEDGQQAIIAFDATVAVASPVFCLLYDGTSYYGAQLDAEVEAGDIIAAGWTATLTPYGLATESQIEVAGKAEVAPQPMPVEPGELLNTCFAWNYVAINNVYMPNGLEEDLPSLAIVVASEEEFEMMNILGLEAQEAGNYNVTGFWINMPVAAAMDGEEEEGEPGTGDGTDDDNIGYTPATQPYFVPATFEVAPLVIDNLVALTDLDPYTQLVIGCDVTVVVTGEAINLIWDGTSYYGAQFNDAVAEGDIIAAGWTAILTPMGLMAAAEVTVSGQAETLPEPIVVDEETLRSTIYNFSYETIQGVTVDEEIDQYGAGVANAGEEEFFIMDLFGFELVPGTYNVTGFWFDASGMLAMNADEDPMDDMGLDAPEWFFVPTAIEEAGTPVIEDFVSMEDIPEMMPFIVGMDVTVAHYEDGFALLYDGTSYYGAQFDQDLAAGDIIAAGWTAYKSMGMMAAYEDVTVSGQGVAPTPMEVTSDNLNESVVNFNFVKILNLTIPEGLDSGDVAVLTITDGEGVITNDMFYTFSSLNPENVYNGIGFWFDVTSMFGGVAPMEDGEPGTGDGSDLDDMGVDAPVYMFIPFSFEKSTGIFGIENAEGDVQYFNINGMRVAEPKAGDVVIKIVGGKATKVLVK